MDPALIATVERLGVRALPAVETHTCEEWLVFVSRGRVSRINSVTTLGRPSPNASDTTDRCEALYRARQLPPMFRLTPLDSQLDDLLENRGYWRLPEVLVMTAPIEPADALADPALSVSPAWLARYGRFGQYQPERTAEIGESLQALGLLHGVFTLEEAAVGVAVVDGGWVGLFDIAVDPGARRRGLGRQISRDMIAWGVAQGADRAYLQVHSDNHAAVGLYHSLGFTTAYRYWYRRT